MYELRVVKEFTRNYENHTRRNARLKRKAAALIEDLRNDPTPRYSEQLKYDLKGKRSIHVDDYRLIYAYCFECRRERSDKIFKCIDCNQLTDQTVKLFDFGLRPKAYR